MDVLEISRARGARAVRMQESLVARVPAVLLQVGVSHPDWRFKHIDASGARPWVRVRGGT